MALNEIFNNQWRIRGTNHRAAVPPKYQLKKINCFEFKGV